MLCFIFIANFAKKQHTLRERSNMSTPRNPNRKVEINTDRDSFLGKDKKGHRSPQYAFYTHRILADDVVFSKRRSWLSLQGNNQLTKYIPMKKIG